MILGLLYTQKKEKHLRLKAKSHPSNLLPKTKTNLLFYLYYFEKHHIFSKSNSDETILLCLNCHGKITSKQNSISPHKRKNKIPFLLLSQGELLKIIGENQIKIALKENGKDFS